MRNPSLVAELRTDQRGRTQIRWVKPGGSGGTGGRGIPAPKPASSTLPHGEVLAEIERAVGVTLVPLEEDETLARDVLGIVHEADGNERVLSSLRDELINMDPEDPVAAASLRFVLVERLYGKHFREMGWLGNPRRFPEITGSARAYVEVAYGTDWEHASPDDIGRAVALGHMAAALHLRAMNTPGVTAERVTYYYLEANPALAGVFDECRDRAFELAEFVIENGPEAGPARAHMRGEEPTVLSDGML